MQDTGFGIIIVSKTVLESLKKDWEIEDIDIDKICIKSRKACEN